MRNTALKRKPAEVFLTPVGRLASECLFEPEERFHMEGRRKVKWTEYHVELAIEPSDLAGLESQLVAAAVAEWGAGVAKDLRAGKIASPIQDGTIRATTGHDKFGVVNGRAGVAVFLADGAEVIYVRRFYAPIGAPQWSDTARAEVYPGCYGQAGVTVAPYADSEGKRGFKLDLVGFQKTR